MKKFNIFMLLRSTAYFKHWYLTPKKQKKLASLKWLQIHPFLYADTSFYAWPFLD